MLHRFSSILRHTTHITTLIFIGGLVFDMLMLPDISHPATRYLGLTHLCIVAVLILFREWLIERNTASEGEHRLYSISTFIIAFSSGAALSFLIVYALRSAEFSVSWPFLLILLLCVIVNEGVSSHSFRLTLDVGILLLATLFFIIFNLPVLTGIQNDMMFVVSIIISVIVSFCYLYFLQFSSESARAEMSRMYALSIGIPIFVFMLYFLSVIPAVPLSLKDSGVYHSITKTESGLFIAEKEIDERRFLFLRTPLYHLSPDDTGVYFFSSVSAPSALTAPLSHVWERYDDVSKRWVQFDAPIAFTLSGGREDGYRAYSKKENITEGLWRVTVMVDSKRVVGRATFRIVKDRAGKIQEVAL